MNDEWYDNKELFKKFEELREQMADLKKDMEVTRTLIRDYNHLREKIEETAHKLNTLMWLTPILVAALGVFFTFLNYIR